MRTPVIPNSEIKVTEKPDERAVKWRGRSGRYYALFQEQLENFVLTGRDLYVITEGDRPAWIGTAGDLIEDQRSRARFRAAVKVASSVLRLSDSGNDVQRMTTIWDLEGGQMDGAPMLAVH